MGRRRKLCYTKDSERARQVEANFKTKYSRGETALKLKEKLYGKSVVDEEFKKDSSHRIKTSKNGNLETCRIKKKGLSPTDYKNTRYVLLEDENPFGLEDVYYYYETLCREMQEKLENGPIDYEEYAKYLKDLETYEHINCFVE